MARCCCHFLTLYIYIFVHVFTWKYSTCFWREHFWSWKDMFLELTVTRSKLIFAKKNILSIPFQMTNTPIKSHSVVEGGKSFQHGLRCFFLSIQIVIWIYLKYTKKSKNDCTFFFHSACDHQEIPVYIHCYTCWKDWPLWILPVFPRLKKNPGLYYTTSWVW